MTYGKKESGRQGQQKSRQFSKDLLCIRIKKLAIPITPRS